jgi:hypothetical protein
MIRFRSGTFPSSALDTEKFPGSSHWAGSYRRVVRWNAPYAAFDADFCEGEMLTNR